ncbi:MAG: MFS transporter [Azospirillaceae bacterium]
MTEARTAASKIATLLVGSALLTLGNGLQGTLVAVRADIEGFGELVTGLVMAAFFVGFVAGSLLTPYLIERAGHIRVFAALASIASAATLAHILHVDPWSWAALRAANGWCYAGVVMVVESWLNGAATRRTRGRVLSVYGSVVIGAWALSQGLLVVADPMSFELFCLVSILISLSLVPVTLSRAEAPGSPRALKLKPRRLWAVSPLGMVGAFATGLAMSAFWAMGPVYARALGLEPGGVALFMGATMAGAMVLQWPIGVASDRVDRRIVVFATASGAAVLAMILGRGTGSGEGVPTALAFAFGGLAIPIYSVCLAQMNDYLEPEELVTAAGGLLLLYGLGSMIGPIGAGALMARFGPSALFAWTGTILIGVAIFAASRMVRGRPVPEATRGEYRSVPRTTQAVLDLDPRGDADGP